MEAKTQNNPGYVRKALWCMGAVLLIQLLKKYLDDSFPASQIFSHFLLTLLQLIILFWTIIILLFPSKSIIKKISILIVILALPELLFTYLLYHPTKIPASLLPAFKRYATQTENETLQFTPKSSVYDKDLFYILKPSSRFVFNNVEFDDSFYINKMGLRDDDGSLQRPEIICLGDSYGMGWGVKQNESYAEQISNSLHKKVLNAAITSYGTARELKNLYRLDTSSLQYIILQFCHNDYTENESLVKNNYSLVISPKNVYDSLLNSHYWNKLWFPGKRLVCISKFYIDKKINPIIFPKPVVSAESTSEGVQLAARHFTDILFHSSINFKKIKVLVIDLNPREIMNNDFLNTVSGMAKSPAYAAHFNNNLTMVPLADTLTAADYFILDPHIRASGHRKVAARLMNYMSR